MSRKTVELEGQVWDLDELKRQCSPASLPGLWQRAKVTEHLGPSALLALACRSTSATKVEARSKLRSAPDFDSARTKEALEVGSIVATGGINNDPFGFLANVKLPPNLRSSLLEDLTTQSPRTEIAGDRLTLTAARKAWNRGNFRSFAMASAKTGDRAVMAVAASVGAGLRSDAPVGFTQRLLEGHTPSIVDPQARNVEKSTNDVLGLGYALSCLDARGLDLITETWNTAPGQWRASAAPWVLPLLDGANGRTVATLLDGVHQLGWDHGARGCDQSDHHNERTVLEHNQIRVQSLKFELTKWFDRPMRFDAGPDQPQILLVQDDDCLYAWVGVNGTGRLVGYDLEDQIPLGRDVPGTRAALALALGWYLDCSISLRKSPSGTTLLKRESTSGRTGVRYVPMPSFNTQVDEVSRGTHSPPTPHGVAAHIRTLPEGQLPTLEARERAPRRLRNLMGPRSTFVQAHQTRGVPAPSRNSRTGFRATRHWPTPSPA